MSFEEAVKKYPEQFSYEPEILPRRSLGEGGLKNFNRFIIAGMGGSGLAAGIIKALKPELDIIEHHDYALPDFARRSLGEGGASGTLFIAISYSGSTKETIDFFNQAQTRGLNVAVVTTGGELLKLAEAKGVPYVQIPDIGVPARMAMGLMIRACLKLMGEEVLLEEVKGLSLTLEPMTFEGRGQALALKISERIPVIYASLHNQAIAYNWRIRLNETGKAPAFFNTFPELAHNEIAAPSAKICPLLIRDGGDDPRVKRGMEIFEKLYAERGITISSIPLEGRTRPERIFNSILLSDWTAYYLAEGQDLSWEEASIIKEFKKTSYGQG